MDEMADLGMPYMENCGSVSWKGISVEPCVMEHAAMHVGLQTVSQHGTKARKAHERAGSKDRKGEARSYVALEGTEHDSHFPLQQRSCIIYKPH